MKYLAMLLLCCGLIFAQFRKPTISIRQLPPEAFPKATCTESQSGYLGITKDGVERTELSDAEIGEYVRINLSKGYSVQVWPQLSGKMFTTQTCLADQQ